MPGDKEIKYVSEVLLDFNEDKKTIAIKTGLFPTFSYELSLQLKPNEGSLGLRVNKKMGPVFYSYGSIVKDINLLTTFPYFTDNGFGKYMIEKHVEVPVVGLLEPEKGVFYLVPETNIDFCNSPHQSDKDKMAAMQKQKELFFNVLTKAENKDKMAEYGHNKIFAEYCEKRAQFKEISSKDEGFVGLPAPPADRNAAKFKKFSDKIIPLLEAELKAKGQNHFKLPYAIGMNRNNVYQTKKEERYVNGLKKNIAIGRIVVFNVVAENLSASNPGKGDYHSRAKYCYFPVNLVEYVKDRGINRDDLPESESEFTGVVEFLASAPPFFLDPEEDDKKVMRYKK